MIGRVAVSDFCRGSRMARSELRIEACDVCERQSTMANSWTHEARAIIVDGAGVGAQLTGDLAQARPIARANHPVETDDNEAVLAMRLAENSQRALDDLRSVSSRSAAKLNAPPTCRPNARR